MDKAKNKKDIIMKLGIAILVCLLPFISTASDITVVEYSFAGIYMVIFSMWGFGVWRKKKIIETSLNFPMVCFLGVCLASVIVALINKVNFIVWARDFAPFTLYLIFLIILDELKTKADISRLISLLFASGCIYLLFDASGLLLAKLVNTNNGIRYIGQLTYWSPLMILCFGLFFISKSRVLKVSTFIFALIFSLRLLFSLNRGTVLSVGLAMVVLSWGLSMIKSINFWKKFILLFVVIVSLFVSLYFFWKPAAVYCQDIVVRFIDLSKVDPLVYENRSFNGRIAEAKAIWGYFLKHPVFGYGLGFEYHYQRIFNGAVVDVKRIGAHNTWLYFLLHIGSIGLCLFLWLVFRSFKLLKSAYLSEKDDYWKAMLVVIAAIFTSFLVQSFCITSIFWTYHSIFISALLMAVVYRIRAQQY